jgi:hypothetical protein
MNRLQLEPPPNPIGGKWTPVYDTDDDAAIWEAIRATGISPPERLAAAFRQRDTRTRGSHPYELGICLAEALVAHWLRDVPRLYQEANDNVNAAEAAHKRDEVCVIVIPLKGAPRFERALKPQR